MKVWMDVWMDGWIDGWLDASMAVGMIGCVASISETITSWVRLD
jgi:hypothetical protein